MGEEKNWFTEYLKHERCGGRGEIETFAHVDLWVIFGHETLDNDGLGCSLFSNQQNSLR